MHRLTWSLCLLLAGPALAVPARAEPQRPAASQPTMPVGERELTVANHAKHSLVELYVSPQTADGWGQDRLGDDQLDPGQSVKVKLGRMRDCSFDVLAVYEDTSREESRGVNVCRTKELAFEGKTLPTEPPGPARSLTVVDRDRLPIQQLFLSPPDAPSWGDDRLAQAALSVDEERHIEFRGDCSADVRVVFSNRAAEERRGVDLCANPRLEIMPGWTTSDPPAAR